MFALNSLASTRCVSEKNLSTIYQQFDLEVTGSRDEFIGFFFNQFLRAFVLCTDKKVYFCSKIKSNMDINCCHATPLAFITKRINYK